MESSSCATEHSPFEIPPEQLAGLYKSQGFQVLRDYLATQDSFCPHHSQGDQQSQQTWLLHRDILHALTMPIVELYERASTLAEAALCTTKPEDLELAFAGEARGAFLFLQCFLGEESDWCQTRGCPACVTMETLSTESHLRLVISASLLSTAPLYSPCPSPAPSDISPLEELHSQLETENSMALPPLPQVLPALRAALEKDAFWGPEYWPYLLERATRLSDGLQGLITSCADLESLVSSPKMHKPPTTRSVTMPLPILRATGNQEEKGVRLKKSKLAKRQLRMKGEETEMMRRFALQCWAKAAMPSKLRNQLLGRPAERRRSLTCP